MRLSWQTVNKGAFTLSVAIVTVFFAGTLVLWLMELEWPLVARRWFWPIAMAAVVGYFTNYIAIQMLFLPYRAEQPHWLKFLTLGLWREGIVPARKREIADAAGKQIAAQILTHDRISREIIQVAERILDDPELRRRIRLGLGPVLRQTVPFIVDRLTPDIVAMLAKAAQQGVNKENIVSFIDEILAPWLATEEVRERLGDVITNVLAENAPQIERFLRTMAEQYSQTSWLRRLAYTLSELFGVIDWQEIRERLKRSFASEQTRRQLSEAVGSLVDSLREAVRTEPDLSAYLAVLAERLREYVSDQVEVFLRQYLPELGERLVDSPALWNWLAHEAVPQLRPQIMMWLSEQGGSRYLAQQFDIAGRVSEAVHDLQVEELHKLVNQVSGSELGAIQVLGFILGAAAGTVMASVLWIAGG